MAYALVVEVVGTLTKSALNLNEETPPCLFQTAWWNLDAFGSTVFSISVPHYHLGLLVSLGSLAMFFSLGYLTASALISGFPHPPLEAGERGLRCSAKEALLVKLLGYIRNT